VLNHLVTELIFSIVTTLDGSTFWLQAQQEIATAQLVNDASLKSCFAHELLLIFGPECWHCKYPSDSILLDLAHLFSQFFNGLIRNESQRLGDNQHQVKLSAVNTPCILVHVQQMHFVLYFQYVRYLNINKHLQFGTTRLFLLRQAFQHTAKVRLFRKLYLFGKHG